MIVMMKRYDRQVWQQKRMMTVMNVYLSLELSALNFSKQKGSETVLSVSLKTKRLISVWRELS